MHGNKLTNKKFKKLLFSCFLIVYFFINNNYLHNIFVLGEKFERGVRDMKMLVIKRC